MFMFCMHSVVSLSSPLLFSHPPFFTTLYLQKEHLYKGWRAGLRRQMKNKKKKKRWTKITLLSCVIASRLSEAVLRVWSDNYFQICVTLKMETETAASIRPWTEREQDLNHSMTLGKENKEKKNGRAIQIQAKSALCKLGVCWSNFLAEQTWHPIDMLTRFRFH